MSSSAAAAPDQAAVNDAPAPPARKQIKKERAALAAIAGELSAGLGGAVASVDQHLGSQDPTLRAWAKQKRKQLRELLATAADAGRPLEERVRLLQLALVAEVETALGAETRSKKAEAELAAAEAAASKRASLCAQLESANQSLRAQVALAGDRSQTLEAQCREAEARFDELRTLVEKVQDSMTESAEVRDAMARENDALRKANAVLTAQNEALQKYSQEAEQRMGALDDLKEKIEAQAKAHEGLQELRKLLEQQAGDNVLLARQLEQRQAEVSELRACLSKAQGVIKMQEDAYTKRREDFEAQIAGFDKAMKSANKLIADLGKRSELLSPLLDQNKTLLEEAAALRGALRRAEAQREQLAALCRALRGGAVVTDAADGCGDGDAPAAGTAAADCGVAAGSKAGGEPAAEGDAAAVERDSAAAETAGTAAAEAAAVGEPTAAEADPAAVAASEPSSARDADSEE